MADVVSFKCPYCGGILKYNGASGKQKCDYCDAEISIEEIKAAEEAAQAQPGRGSMVWASSAPAMVQDEDGKVSGYICSSCGAEMVADENTAATECPYCGNQAIMPHSFEGMYKPDLMLPFAVDKSVAQKALENFCQGKKLLPDTFKKGNRIREINGIYVPFWLMSCHTGGSVTFEGVKTKTWEDDNYRYEKKDYYRVVRQGEMDFTRIPVDASTKMDDATMDSLEPFDLSKAVPYDAAYFSGYLADRYDVDSKAAEPRANERVRNSFRQKMRDAVHGYNSVTRQSESIQLSNARADYAMLPVWMLTTVYEDKKYVFGINGQSGKIVGSLPVDMGKYYKYLLIAALISLVLLTAAVAFLFSDNGFNVKGELIAVAVSLLIGFLYAQGLKAAMNTVSSKTEATSYLAESSIRMGRNEDAFIRTTTDKREKAKKEEKEEKAEGQK